MDFASAMQVNQSALITTVEGLTFVFFQNKAPQHGIMRIKSGLHQSPSIDFHEQTSDFPSTRYKRMWSMELGEHRDSPQVHSRLSLKHQLAYSDSKTNQVAAFGSTPPTFDLPPLGELNQLLRPFANMEDIASEHKRSFKIT